ncbi:MAG: hypothetical protein Q3965_03550 [Rothia sp. (in: high G+C Gram-positive bacteria)]|nr:hypothetical protein [Rothia sp. (in: high G+C Gram-positive bacteria)]
MTTATTTNSSVQLAASLLRTALLEPEAKKIWKKHLLSENFGEDRSFSVRAIARAIHAHQERTYGLASPSFKDRVARALTGNHLSIETLDLFCETFNFSDKMVDALNQILLQGSETVELSEHLPVHPETVISSAFIDVRPLPHQREAEIFATYTLTALEAGCSSFLLPLPGCSSLEVLDTEGFQIFSPAWEGGWLVAPQKFIAPLQTFMFRFKAVVQTDECDGYQHLTIPFHQKNFALALRVNSQEQNLAVSTATLPISSHDEPQQEQAQTASPYASYYYPVLQNALLRVSWQPEKFD